MRYFTEKNINLAVHPAQSPDFNPIELIWNDLKYYIKTKIKPKDLRQSNDNQILKQKIKDSIL